MPRFKRVSKDDLVPSSVTTVDPDVSADASAELPRSRLVVRTLDDGSVISFDPADPANVRQDKTRVGWWLPGDAESWSEIPEPEAGSPTKEKPLTVEQLMRREREFHLFGRGAGGKHLPDHSARFIAFILDYALHGAVAFLGVRGINTAYPDILPARQVVAVAVLGSWVLLSVIPLLLWRSTPGKLLLGLRVVRANGDEASAIKAIFRGVVLLLLPLAIPDAFVVMLSPHRRRLIDYVTGTRVVANS